MVVVVGFDRFSLLVVGCLFVVACYVVCWLLFNVGVCCLLLVVLCWLLVACCSLVVASCFLLVVWYSLRVARCSLFVVCCLVSLFVVVGCSWL